MDLATRMGFCVPRGFYGDYGSGTLSQQTGGNRFTGRPKQYLTVIYNWQNRNSVILNQDRNNIFSQTPREPLLHVSKGQRSSASSVSPTH